MRLLVVHNRYIYRGGEDSAVSQEFELLARGGHDVSIFEFSNDHLGGSLPLRKKAQSLRDAFWNSGSHKSILDVLSNERFDIVHVHNWFPTGSPSIHAAATLAGAPVVQTLHNYRLICPNALLFRDGHVCEDCLGKFVPWPGVAHRCYRDSRAQTGVTAAMLTFHRVRQTWQCEVDRFIALSQFSHRKFVEGGLPADRLRVKPNFIDRPDRPQERNRDYLLFIGRVADYKGVELLPKAWADLPSNPPLRVVGDGPAFETMSASFNARGHIQLLGAQPHLATMEQLNGALALIVPSLLYENFPMTIVEAFASGVAVIASRLGSMAEIVEDGRTGLLFEPGDAAALASKVEWAWTHPQEMLAMGANARQEYEQKYTAERNYEILMEIYQQAIEHRKARLQSRWPE